MIKTAPKRVTSRKSSYCLVANSRRKMHDKIITKRGVIRLAAAHVDKGQYMIAE